DYEKLKRLSDDQFIDFIEHKFQAIPKQLLEDRRNIYPFIPRLRADFALLAHKLELLEPFDVPITTIHCIDDPGLLEEEIKRWSKATSRSYEHINVPGGHLSLLNDPMPFIQIISSCARLIGI